MSTDIPRPNPDKHDLTRHGNRSHGIDAAAHRLRKGLPFDGYAQECYERALTTLGYTEPDLATLGVRGELIRVTCRMSALSDLVWSGILGAASVGSVDGFYTIAKNYGHRLDQARRAWRELLDIEREAKAREASVIDLTAAVDAAQGAKGNCDASKV